MHTLLPLLIDSIKKYNEIEVLMESMLCQELTKPVEHLVTIGKTILDKQKYIAIIDENIVNRISSYNELPENEAFRTNLSEWMNTQKRLIVPNKKILPKLEGTQSLIANEHNKIKNGRTAIKGYSFSESANGKNINNRL